jgi:hypothetical protein
MHFAIASFIIRHHIRKRFIPPTVVRHGKQHPATIKPIKKYDKEILDINIRTNWIDFI